MTVSLWCLQNRIAVADVHVVAVVTAFVAIVSDVVVVAAVELVVAVVISYS